MSEGNSHFLAALERVDAGRVVEEADARLSDVVAAVGTTGKAGSVNVKVTVKPNGEFGLEVSADVASSLPKQTFGKSFFFPGKGNTLTRTPPEHVARDLMRQED